LSVIFCSPRAEERLARALDWLAKGGRDQATLVVGATGFAARSLVQKATLAVGASFGWQATTLGALALSRAMPRLLEAGVAAAGGAILEGLTVRALHRLKDAGALGRWAALAERPGLARAVARTIGELRLGDVDPDKLADTAPEIAKVLREVGALLEAEKLADRAALMKLASAASPGAGKAPALLLLDVPIFTTLESAFVAQLAAAAPRTFATVPAGDDRTLARLHAHWQSPELVAPAPAPAGALGRLQTQLFYEGPSPAGAPGDDVVFLSAPGESRECVEIARRILREAEAGTPFDRIAVLLRTPGQYRAHLGEALRRARIPVHFSSGAVEPDPAGRAFLALLTCLEEGLSARRFAEYLSLGETPDATEEHTPPPPPPATERWVPPEEELVPAALGRESEADADEAEREAAAEAPPPPAASVNDPVIAGTLRAPRRWEQILVDAAVIGGRDRWSRRLGGWRKELELRLAEYEADDPRVEGTKRDLVHLEALRRFALPILDDLAALPQAATWGDWLEQLSALATRTLRRPERVLAVLAELSPMAPVGPVGLREVRLVLGRRLANLVIAAPHRSAGRVFVGPISAARGLSFDLVFVPGLAERMFPQRVTEDPLLGDDVRRAQSRDLATAVDRIEAERLALRIAVGSASRRVVLSYSRIDAEQARPRVPSFYGLEVLRAVEGRLPSFEGLARTADRGSASRLGWPAPENPAEAIDEAEHDLAWLAKLVRPSTAAITGAARYLITSNPHLARALRHRALRFDPGRWSYADGLVKPDEAARAVLATKHALSVRSYSPTALQTFAACPYRFVLHAIHKLAPREEPIAIERIDALDKGSLVHETLYALLTELRERGLVPIRPDNFAEARAALDRVLEREAARYKDELAPAIDRVWDDGIGSIRADLIESLRRETERPAWTPRHLELAFGLAEARGRDPASRKEPVPLDCGITLRGSIDLVEAAADGSLRATDHKTGKARQRPGAIVGGGESLQPVFYALVLEKLFPERAIAGGRLSYCTSAGEFKEVVVPLDHRARDAANRVAAALADALTRGFLPAAPGRDACRFCDYRPVCGPWEEERTRKKKLRNDLAALEEVRKLP
jgi:ATP-dependent helicase/nuclease subunit B